jgi:hypothetical protein
MNWKMIYLARRNPALAPEEFPAAWRGHSALGRQCRNVQDKVLTVTQCSRLLAHATPGCSTAYDGVNLLRLRDRQAADDIWSDAETLAIMRPDEPRVFDRYVRDFTLVASEQVLREGSRADAVLVAFLRKQPDVASAHFQSAMEKADAVWPDASCVVLNIVEAERPPGYDFDAIVEWWFTSADALSHALQAADLQDPAATHFDAVCAAQDSVFMATGVTHRRP